MCYIMLAKKVNNHRLPDTEEKLKKIAIAKMKANPDGSFLQYGKEIEIRTMDNIAMEKAIQGMSFDNVMMHFRYATVGKKGKDNVHGWKVGPWQFLHNGGISDYNFTKTPVGFNTGQPKVEQEHADSKLFFDDLRKEIEKCPNGTEDQIIEAIRNKVDDVTFWGRAVLYNHEEDLAYLFGDWHVYLVDNSYIVFSSADISDLNRVEEKTQKVHGMEFEVSLKPIFDSFSEATFDGVAIIRRYSQPNYRFKYRSELEYPKQYTSYQGYNFTQYEEEELESKYNSEINEVADDTPRDKDWEKEYEASCDALEEAWLDFEEILSEVPEYQSMNPFELDTYTNETGTHDLYGICCRYETCWIYQQEEYQKFQNLQFYPTQPKLPLAPTVTVNQVTEGNEVLMTI